MISWMGARVRNHAFRAFPKASIDFLLKNFPPSNMASKCENVWGTPGTRIASTSIPAAFIFSAYASPSSRRGSISAVQTRAGARFVKFGAKIGDIFQSYKSKTLASIPAYWNGGHEKDHPVFPRILHVQGLKEFWRLTSADFSGRGVPSQCLWKNDMRFAGRAAVYSISRYES